MQQIPTQAPDLPPAFSVLVVDDTAVLRKVLENKCLTTLEGRGLLYSVQTAENGEQGLALTENHHYDVYIIDKNMPPGMDGVEVCRKILIKEPNAKVILNTAADEAELQKEDIPAEVEIIHKNPAVIVDSLIEQIEIVKTRTMAGRRNSSGGTPD